MTVGMTLVELHQGAGKLEIKKLIQKAKRVTPEGRQLCVVYPFPNAWKASMPFEAIITSIVLGSPSVRTEPHSWVFSGNICIRRCKVRSNERLVLGEVGVLMFRRSGDMAYKKRTQLDQAIIRKATLDSLHPVFTRDVANNVWHLPEGEYLERTYRRLQALFTWPGETTLIFGPSGVDERPWKRLSLGMDLVGIPTKRDYEWVTNQPELPLRIK